jgi:hypothetical protein
MQEHQIESIVAEQRRDVNPVLDLELAVALLGIEVPDLLAVEIVAGTVAGTDKGVDVLAVGAGRGGSLIGFVFLDCQTGRLGELLFPDDFAVDADADQLQIVVLGAGQEDAIAPDHRSRAALARQRQFPSDVLGFAPRRRQALFLRQAVAVGATP